MRLISFMLTADQIKARTKTETRRLGWRTVKVGDRLRGVLKSQGRTRKCHDCNGRGRRRMTVMESVRSTAVGAAVVGMPMFDPRCEACNGSGKITDPIVDLAIVEVTEVRRERLDAITPEAVVAEGFPQWTNAPGEFVEMFCRSHKGCTPSTEVTVIRFRYVDASAAELEAAAASLAEALSSEEEAP